MTGPTVPVSGPEDGARDPADRLSDLLRGERIGSEVIRSDEARRLANKLVASVVADTTAGEAETVSDWERERRAAAEFLPPLAARSGGAQDDGLNGRVEALAAGMEHWQAGDSYVTGDEEVTAMWAQCLRRALAGPDDARQDGAR